MALVIAVLTSSLILLAYHHRLYQARSATKQRLQLNAHSAMLLLLSGTEEFEDKPETIDLFLQGEDSVSLIHKKWGLFDVGAVWAKQGVEQVSLAFLYGYAPDKEGNSAIYLQDNDRHLGLSGNTRLKGTCYLPKLGAKVSYVDSRVFEGSDLVDGEIKVSKPTLPQLDQKRIAALQEAFQLMTQSAKNARPWVNDAEKDSLLQSFTDTTIFFSNASEIQLGQCFVKGNVCIQSKQKITVKSQARLQDVVLIAPTIYVESGFKGRLQLIASDSLIIEKECQLDYPSAAVLIERAMGRDSLAAAEMLRIGAGTKFEGIVLAYTTEKQQKHSLISIEEKAIVTGQVYTSDFLELKGSVNGGVMCHRFLLKTAAAIYENVLLDVSIDQTALPAFYVGSGILPSRKTKRIVQWLF